MWFIWREFIGIFIMANGQSFQTRGTLSPSWNHWNSHFFKWVFLIRHTLWWYHESWDNKCCASYGHLWSNASEGLWFFIVEIPIERKYVTGHRANTRQKKLFSIATYFWCSPSHKNRWQLTSVPRTNPKFNPKNWNYMCMYIYIYMALGYCKMGPSWFWMELKPLQIVF